MPAGTHVLITEDHPLTAEGLQFAVRAAMPGFATDTARSIVEAEQCIQRRGGYRLALLDLVLPDTHGFSGFLRLQHLLRATPIVIVTARRDAVLVESARALGAAGFLHKSRGIDDLTDDLRRISQGQRVFPPIATIDANAEQVRLRIGTLSKAQLRVLLALADGRLNKQIAGDLAISEATVKAHLSAIFRKLGVNNRAQALLAVQPLLGDIAADAPA